MKVDMTRVSRMFRLYGLGFSTTFIFGVGSDFTRFFWSQEISLIADNLSIRSLSASRTIILDDVIHFQKTI